MSAAASPCNLEQSHIEWVDITISSGLTFIHHNAASEDYLFPEIMGSGVAMFDLEQDGDLDILLINSGQLGQQGTDESTIGRLYRNDLGETGLTFTDVTDRVGVLQNNNGMGVVSGDLNGDGQVDLILLNFGVNEIWLNNGRGGFDSGQMTFSEDPGDWSVSGSLFDMDHDGDLDLYIANYNDFTIQGNKPCTSRKTRQDYCGPLSYQPVSDRLYRNDTTIMTDVTATHLKSPAIATGLGVIAFDVNDDGWQDVYVANDGMPNFLWINQNGEGFSEEALMHGVAADMNGKPEASMGVAVSDYDHDGDPDLIMTHLVNETNTLYRNEGGGWFSDHSVVSGISRESLGHTGFGVEWIDYDMDGRMDLFSVNGEVSANESLVAANDPFPYHQANQLMRQTAKGKMIDVSSCHGTAISQSAVSRGAAFGDLDNDGDTDIIIANNGGPAQLLRLDHPANKRWLGVDLQGPPGLVHGAVVTITDESDFRRTQIVQTDGSYASASDHRVLFGLNGQPTPARLEIIWADGTRQSQDVLTLNQYVKVVKTDAP